MPFPQNLPGGRTRAAISRRDFFRGTGAGAAGVAFAALAERVASGGASPLSGRGYGKLSPKPDRATGLHLLALPDGFTYTSYGWTGQVMNDMRPTPTAHDGMAVVARRRRFLALVRNHELTIGFGPRCFVRGGMYDDQEYGGTTSLLFDRKRGRFVCSWTSLGGTARNCAGGPTPWGSWLSCEETFHGWITTPGLLNHGYLFEVPGFGISDGKPIRAAGRFVHEAAAVDPRTGIVYETEDDFPSGIYRYIPPGCDPKRKRRRCRRGPLKDGGRLEAMVIDGKARMDMSQGFKAGKKFKVTWEPVTDPEGKRARAFDSAPRAAGFMRGEGCWWDSKRLYFVSTSGGAAGLGQVYEYDPRKERLRMIYESSRRGDVDSPDNIAVSPRGAILLCEDGSTDPKRLVGLSRKGKVFHFAENRIDLKKGDIDVIDRVFPGAKASFVHAVEGSYTWSEWAGATFHGRWLFANVQSPGVTFAITGPWHRGGL